VKTRHNKPNPIIGYLNRKLNQEILVELQDGALMAGKLNGFDRHLNLVIETNEGEVIVRGSSIKRIR